MMWHEDDLHDEDLLTTRDSEDEECPTDDESNEEQDKENTDEVVAKLSIRDGEKICTQPNWPVDNTVMNGCRWLSKFKSTTVHMFICHEYIEYFKNVRHASSVYKKGFHFRYGNAYELHINHCKVFVTTSCLQANGYGANKMPQKPIEENVDQIAEANLIQCQIKCKVTHQVASIQAHLVTYFNAINTIGLSQQDNDYVTSQSDSNVKNLAKFVGNNYSWKSEDGKVRKIKSNYFDEPTLFDLFKSCARIMLKFKCTPLMYHNLYFPAFECALRAEPNNYTDSVTNVTWVYKSILKAVSGCAFEELTRIKHFDCDPDNVLNFMDLSKRAVDAHVLYHAKAKFTGKEQHRLNCFKINDTHIWINSVVYKNSANNLPLIDLLNSTGWGVHHIISLDYMNNQELKRIHVECVRFVVRYIMERRDLKLLRHDITKQDKLRYTFIHYKV
ncbi:ie-1 [Hyphantria cunea granulovirus]|uniref:Ie-1 n=1 Tax=Hyphantria cunea granulovirus TaxID=307448 RepID=A0AAF1D249_9BBAC|nr:ie-1 [Hyphantria cunea granulovirus]QBQ01559.1 ie-1 [Hyphantria cunea granulovirus]